MTPGTPSKKAQTEADPGTGTTGAPPARGSSKAPSAAGAPGLVDPSLVPALAAPGLLAQPAFFSASHELLFEPTAPRCDACDGPLTRADADAAADDADDSDEAGGHGLYIWARSGGLVYEEPPLCASCAAAITMTALSRWDIEEEEG